MRRAAVVTAAALAGIALAAAITWGTSQLVRQRIGLASEPLSAGQRLLPAAVGHGTRAGAPGAAGGTTATTRTVTRTVSTPPPPRPTVTAPATAPPAQPPVGASVPTATAPGARTPAGERSSDSTDSRSRDD